MEDWGADSSPCNFVTTHFPAEEALLSPCNFATTQLTASILNCYLPLTSRPMKWRTLSQRPIGIFRNCGPLLWLVRVQQIHCKNKCERMCREFSAIGVIFAFPLRKQERKQIPIFSFVIVSVLMVVPSEAAKKMWKKMRRGKENIKRRLTFQWAKFA